MLAARVETGALDLRLELGHRGERLRHGFRGFHLRRRLLFQQALEERGALRQGQRGFRLGSEKLTVSRVMTWPSSGRRMDQVTVHFPSASGR